MAWTQGRDDRRARYRPLGLFLLATLAVGAAASLVTEPAIRTWYAGLIRPAIAPPDWLFAPIWTALYVLMAVAAWRVWMVTRAAPFGRSASKGKMSQRRVGGADQAATEGVEPEISVSPFGRSASKGKMSQRRVGEADQAAAEGVEPEMAAFWLQLLLNFCWSVLFFGLRQIGFALAESLLLDLAVLVTLILFWRRERVAGMILVPYLGWSCFASLLTYEFWRLNP
jgi:tryptophan-rich sensory protein